MEVAHNVMPLAGATDPPASFIAVALALQVRSLIPCAVAPHHLEGRLGPREPPAL
jgi:hypothetical protein